MRNSPRLATRLDHRVVDTTTAYSRREFMNVALGGVAMAALGASARAQTAGAPRQGMAICLTPGSIGVSAKQKEAIALADRHGFDAVEPFGSELASFTDQESSEVVADLKARGLVWGAAGLPVDYRQDEAKFTEGMMGLPRISTALARAGVSRVGTWVMSGHNSLTYLQNLRQHAKRLRAAALVLKDHGQRLGLEYVGTATLRNSRKYPFVHTLAEAKELIAEIGAGNVGLVLDSWHWWQAGDSVDDLLSLKNEEIISVDLNDAPANVLKDQQIDGRRELPCATGIIDLAAFMKALKQIGYDGPARPEPFNKLLNDLDNEEACAATIKAMRKAFEFLL